MSKLGIPACFVILAGVVAVSEAEPQAAAMERTAAVYVRASYDDVWKQLTDPAAYGGWSSAPCLAFGTEAGDRVAWGSKERTVYEGELLSIEKGKGFAYTFAFQGFGFEETTEVHVDVVEQGPVVLVALRHVCTGAPNTHGMIGAYGWTKSLCRLKTLLETGTTMPWPEEDAR